MSNDQPNEAARVTRVSSRARIYQLSDDGASDRALRKRYHRNNRGHLQALIERLERQIETGALPYRSTREQVEQHLVTCRIALAKALEESAVYGPTPTIVAPVGRRVRREDRRRKRLAQR